MATIIKNSNSKLGKLIGNINMPTSTCRLDAPCKQLCYARKGHFVFKNVRQSFDNTYSLFLSDPKRIFDQINAELLVTPYSYVRWPSIGDIPNSDYLAGMVRVARHNRNTRFLCFTKQYEIVNTYIENGGKIPSNLILVFSNWGDWKCENPFNLPEAYIKFRNCETEIPPNATECSGFCGACVNTKASCWKLKKGGAVYFHQH